METITQNEILLIILMLLFIGLLVIVALLASNSYDVDDIKRYLSSISSSMNRSAEILENIEKRINNSTIYSDYDESLSDTLKKVNKNLEEINENTKPKKKK